MMIACDSADYSYNLYLKIRDLPETFTRLQIKKLFKIILNGDAYLDNPALLTATDISGSQLIVKVLKINDDFQLSIEERQSLVAQEVLACTTLGLEDNPLAFANISVIEVSHGIIVMSALVMPRYLTTVAQSAKFYDEIINREGLRLVTALDYMHEKGLIHLDIKGSNIFIGKETGSPWCIGDFGSSRRVGETVLSTTFFFYKKDIRKTPALAEYDWYMLLVVILIESLDDKHSWAEHLKQESSCDFICDVMLKKLLKEKLKGVLRDVLLAIVKRLDWVLEA
jgi:serine/threonine protein kinase